MNVLITGGTRGIGAKLASLYEAEGHQVFAPGRAQMAVEDTNAIARYVEGLPDHLDLLVCNAGVYPDHGKPLGTHTGAMWAEALAINVTGVFMTVQACLSRVKAGPGKIAIIASKMGSSARAPGGAYLYRASKAAAVNMGRNLAQDLKSDHVPLGIYHPGWVTTDMGGPTADIDVATSATGLKTQFTRLDLATTGCFRDYTGADLPL